MAIVPIERRLGSNTWSTDGAWRSFSQKRKSGWPFRSFVSWLRIASRGTESTALATSAYTRKPSLTCITSAFPYRWAACRCSRCSLLPQSRSGTATAKYALPSGKTWSFPHIAGEHLEAAKAAILAAGLTSMPVPCSAEPSLAQEIKGCRFAASDTKTHAVTLANMLDNAFRILGPVNLHVTGCAHSCAQHYVGDLGLMGVKVGGEEGYQVILGGGSDQDQGLARELFSAVKFSDLPPRIHNLFSAYTQRAMAEESFLAFTRRHAIDELKAFCQPEERS